MRFGAFIMTFNRPEILSATLDALARQTTRPELILIVDNSVEETARPVAAARKENVHYHPMRENTGPAGAARFGLQWFKDQGFDWVYWGDDDNPPETNDIFQRIFEMIREEGSDVGIGVAVGQRFDFRKGRVIRLTDEQLTGHPEVDVVSGPSSMVINLKAVNEKTLPDARLFFGFEEFEFALKIKNAGYRIIADGNLMRELRAKYGRLNLQSSRQAIRPRDSMWREYYSIRNMIYLFYTVYPQHRRIALYRIFAAFGKVFLGFRYGIVPGLKNVKYQVLAVYHGLTGKLGFRISSK